MILDPRLVPWEQITPGIILAVVITLAALVAAVRWPRFSIGLLAIAPAAGWALCFQRLLGRIPPIPPPAAPHWAFYFAFAGTALIPATIFLRTARMRWITAISFVLVYLAAIFLTIIRPLSNPDIGPPACIALGLAAAVAVMPLALPVPRRWASAAYAPWLPTLAATAAVLALTGTASLSFLALALALCALPPAIALLFPHVMKSLPLRNLVLVLSLALPLPVMILTGSLYASTPWSDATLLLAAPIAGMVALHTWAWLASRVTAFQAFTTRHPATASIIAIFPPLIAASIPVAITITRLLEQAAAEPSFY